jgi:uncharacterized membrane protein (UPF0127 family)
VAIVTIREKQWTCSVASTFTELTRGLSGVPAIPAGTGMLFDLGVDCETIQIDMSRMLFALDIIFINSTRGVVGMLHNVQPGWTDVRLENETLPGARCFLEVNAGEAEGIEVGDSVNIQGYARPAELVSLNGIVYAMSLLMISAAVFKALEEPKERPAPLPQTELIRQHERTTRSAVIPTEKRPRREDELEFLPDSPEFLTQTIEAIGYREKLDSAFQEAIRRAKGLKQW